MVLSSKIDPRKIDAAPTKDFFIFMLVRDIQLMPAVVDLADNCIDGALRIRLNREFRDLWVRLEVDAKHFRISDNCGGISVELARNYAFHFGRPPNAPTITHSVGQFGVGMKRALFKIGRKFKIESTSARSHFVVEVDVDKWRSTRDWEFRFSELEEGSKIATDRQGTVITVNPLNAGVANDFALDAFQTELAETIGERHQENMARGISISLNQVPVNIRPSQLLSSSRLKPAYMKLKIQPQGRVPIIAKIWAGIGPSEPRNAGWYIFCNGRMVLDHDQTLTTGWGEGGETKIPKYHNQFAMFRGYVFFDSDDGGLLPWNTTKTSVDLDSPVYRSARLHMITLMRPVIDFLNKFDEEKAREGVDGGPLSAAVENSKLFKLAEVQSSSSFVSPKSKITPSPATARIAYDKPVEEIDRVKKVLNERSNKRVVGVTNG